MTETVLGVQRGTGIFYAYNTIIIFPASVCLFMAFKNMKIKNRIISNAAISIGTRCFGAYLATDNPLIRSSLWEFINLPQYGKSGISVMLIQLFFSVIVLFGMGCVIDYFRIILFRLFGINKLTLAADNCAYVIRKQISVLLERL